MGNYDNAKVSGDRVGNTTGNIMNGGLAAKQGDWIYYFSDKDIYDMGICKMFKDGSNSNKITDTDGAGSINIVNDWIYYGYKGICKVRTDGSGWEKISDDKAGCVHVVNDWIYYSEECSFDYTLCNIYKMRIDGSEKELLLKDNMFGTFCVSGECIYYIGDVNKRGDRFILYKYSPYEKYRKRLSKDQISEFCIQGNSIYYINQDELTYIYKISTNGGGRKRILIRRTNSINAHGNWLYYVDHDLGDIICKKNIRSGGKSRLNNNRSCAINIAGVWIFYINKDDYPRSRNYKVHIDGSESLPA